MVDISGYSFIDGIDLWTAFGIFVEEGSADFLRWAPKKETIVHDWMDSNGIEVDTSRFFLKERRGGLNCGMIANSEATFWQNHRSFIATLMQPGLRRLNFRSHGDNAYYVHYIECSNYIQVKPLLGKDESIYGPNRVAGRFTLIIEEPNPQIDPSMVYLVDEEGRFIVT
jgi:hypothetical protein